ncbi:MAG: hypothetical protein IJU19_04530 [Bacteroidales bacterium]|nr:hypothetical protein [Bacteroidales bacterium]
MPKESICIKSLNITVGTRACAPIENPSKQAGLKIGKEVAEAIRNAQPGSNIVIQADVVMPDGIHPASCVIGLAE